MFVLTHARPRWSSDRNSVSLNKLWRMVSFAQGSGRAVCIAVGRWYFLSYGCAVLTG